jgi:hypothetical protein
MISQILPPYLRGVMFAALCGAVMRSFNSGINSAPRALGEAPGTEGSLSDELIEAPVEDVGNPQTADKDRQPGDRGIVPRQHDVELVGVGLLEVDPARNETPVAQQAKTEERHDPAADQKPTSLQEIRPDDRGNHGDRLLISLDNDCPQASRNE